MTPLLKARGLKKRFGGNEAVKDVSFDVNEGECVVLAGDNGAGKSTVIKMISGVYVPTAGEVFFNDQLLTGQSPNAVRQSGIETIYQDLALADNLDPGLNLYLGREATRRIFGISFVARRAMRERAQEVLEGLGIVIPDPSAPVRDLSGGQRQAIAIARAIHWKAKLVIMDEPTAALGPQETARTLSLIETLKAQDLAIILISHSLDDVFAVSDRIQVMRRGRRVGSVMTPDTTREEVLGMIVGGTKAA